MKIKVGLVDDDKLLVRSLCALIDTFPGFEAVLYAFNGEDLLRKLTATDNLPDIMLLDVNMKEMNGVATARTVSKSYPLIRLAALSMKDDDTTIISMIRSGCCAYLVKDISPEELEKALLEISEKGFYNGDRYNVDCRRLLRKEKELLAFRLTDREKEFLQLSCEDKTYKQVASEMHLSERTIDGYRESLFEKLDVQSRVGMVMEALRRELINLPPATISQ